jgi:ankyrin repeat protein
LQEQNIYGQTLLHLAVESGHIEVVKWILDTCENEFVKDNLLKTTNSNGKSAFFMATECGHYSIVEYLLQTQHIDIDCRDDSEMTPLMAACIGGTDSHCDIALLLLDHNANATLTSIDGDTTLIWAAIGGSVDVVNRSEKGQMESW